jgi:DNA-binding Lrp family transcriptional regulator
MEYVSSAFVLLNCDIGAERSIIDELNKITGVTEAVRVSGIYDIVAKLSEQSKEDVISLLKQIRVIGHIRSSLTMIIAKYSNGSLE